MSFISASLCVKQDGLADSSLIRNWDIDVSSNKEHKANIRPSGKGWAPESGDKKLTVSIFVGDALVYGASVQLLQAKGVAKYDVFLLGSDNGNLQRFKVRNKHITKLHKMTACTVFCCLYSI